jgi:multidrug efflux pump subunit AcrA (membrane-fusion protein)
MSRAGELGRKSAVSSEDLLRAAIPVAIIAVASLGYYWFSTPIPPQTEEKQDEIATPVVVAAAKPFTGQIEIKVEGVASPFRRINLAAEVSGRIKFKSPIFEEGNFVAEGTVLAEIDPVDYEISLRRIKEELLQANNALSEWKTDRENVQKQIELSKEDLKLTQKEVARVRGLRERDAIADTELDKSLRAEVAAQTALLQFSNQLRVLDAREARAISMRDLQMTMLERAERDLARTKIVAPCNGTIIAESVEQDGYIKDGSTIAIFNDTSASEIACNLELDDLFWIWGTRNALEIKQRSVLDPSAYYEFPKTKVTVEFPFQGLAATWEGELTRFAGTGIDPKTRTIPCRVHVSAPSKGKLKTVTGVEPEGMVSPPLTTGMFVTVYARVTPHSPLLELPAEAIRSGDVAWIMRDGKLHIQPVQVARRMAEQKVLIYATDEGLQPDDRVVVTPMAMVREGMALTERTSS